MRRGDDLQHVFGGGTHQVYYEKDHVASLSDPAPTQADVFMRFYQLEILFLSWLVIGATIITFGAYVYININVVIGIIMLCDGLLFSMFSIIGVIMWLRTGELDLPRLLETRHVLLIWYCMLSIVFVVVSAAVGIIMIKKTTTAGK